MKRLFLVAVAVLALTVNKIDAGDCESCVGPLGWQFCEFHFEPGQIYEDSDCRMIIIMTIIICIDMPSNLCGPGWPPIP